MRYVRGIKYGENEESDRGRSRLALTEQGTGYKTRRYKYYGREYEIDRYEIDMIAVASVALAMIVTPYLLCML